MKIFSLDDYNTDPDHTVVRADKASAKRIIARAVTEGWWFWHQLVDGGATDGRDHCIVFSSAVSLDKDLIRRLPNLNMGPY